MSLSENDCTMLSSRKVKLPQATSTRFYTWHSLSHYRLPRMEKKPNQIATMSTTCKVNMSHRVAKLFLEIQLERAERDRKCVESERERERERKRMKRERVRKRERERERKLLELKQKLVLPVQQQQKHDRTANTIANLEESQRRKAETAQSEIPEQEADEE